MAINGIVQQYTSGFLPDILLFTQAPILVWFDGGTIIDNNSTIDNNPLNYVLRCLRLFLPDIILLTQGHYHGEPG